MSSPPATFQGIKPRGASGRVGKGHGTIPGPSRVTYTETATQTQGL